MKRHYIYDDIPYTIIYSDRRKTSEIQVSSDGIKVRVPYQKKDQEIMELINSKKQWIKTNYLEIKTKKEQYKTTTDKSYVLKRTKELASLIEVNPSKIIIKNLKTMWGSATSDNVITINSRLFKAPKDVMDYIIIHELCHLRIHGHSSAYWNLVRIHMPDYKDKILWLEKHGRFI